MEGFDLSGVGETFASLRNIFGLFRDVKGLLGEGKQKEAEELISRAERQSVAAEAQLARALGYRLHRCTWPPQIMLLEPDLSGETEIFKCPNCGNHEEEEPGPGVAVF